MGVLDEFLVERGRPLLRLCSPRRDRGGASLYLLGRNLRHHCRKKKNNVAWDTERTKALLLMAAVNEFSTKGPSGACGSGRSCCRYQQGADLSVLRQKRSVVWRGPFCLNAESSRGAMRYPWCGPAVIGEYAGTLFDLHINQPATAHLLFWEGLERGMQAQVTEDGRITAETMVRSLQHALPGIPLDRRGHPNHSCDPH